MAASGAVVGLLHPGEMGAALGAALYRAGHEVLWASTGRSAETAGRAAAGGLVDAVTLRDLVARADVVLSVCPPHAAPGVAASVDGFGGLFVDANAVSPATSRAIGSIVERGGARYVDGGIIGAPPSETSATRLYLAGRDAAEAAALFAGTNVVARVVSDEIGAASALKMAYAAWTKGTAALLLAIAALARRENVETALLGEWRESLPELLERMPQAARSAAAKGWRWVGEMEEIAATFGEAGLPTGFHLAAADVYDRIPRLPGVAPEGVVDDVVAKIAAATTHT